MKRGRDIEAWIPSSIIPYVLEIWGSSSIDTLVKKRGCDFEI
jgi:hypothetical protein